MLLSETTGNETLRYYYDSAGRVASIGYQKGTAAEVGYFFTRNLHGDIIGVYQSSDSKLIGTYEYDLWGKLISVKEASKGIDTNGILTKNPFRYRGYYYDNETGFYNLNFRYYDPAIRRFISADSTALLMTATTSIGCKNLFNYCENNPVNGKDSSGAVIETPFDLVTLGISIVDVCVNPTDPWAWLGLIGDAVDLVPCVTGVGEAVKGAKYAVRYGDEAGAAMADFFRWLGKSDKANDASKVVKGSFEIANLSKSALKHPLNRHTPARVAQQFSHMSDEAVSNYLKNVTFFNRSWTESQITDALNYVYKKAVANGVVTGEYSFEYLGDTVTVYLEEGVFKSGYGDYVYSYEEIMSLLRE